MGNGKLLVLVLLNIGFLNAQKVIKKSILNPNTSSILIDTGNCFKLDLTTTISKEIVIEAIIDGEYKNDLLLKIEEQQSATKISTGFHPSFVNPNDKLSAHKVVSIALKVQIPEHMKVRIIGTSCNANINGTYDILDVSMDDGICNLENVSKSVHVVTQSGDIHVRTNRGDIVSKSTFGNVFKANIPRGNSNFNLSTITGNIYLKKTE